MPLGEGHGDLHVTVQSPLFHGPVVLPYNSDYLMEKFIPWILVPFDTKSDLKIYVGQFDLYFMVQ